LTLFTLTIFLGSFLLFLVQPMFARLVLPLLGGSPAVWNTALVFYQALLLAGYWYAHAATRRLGVRRQALLHLAIMTLPLLVLPPALPAGSRPPGGSTPIPWLLGVLAVSVGPSFFVVSAGGPLLQRWFAATRHQAAADPYFLYAASNAGSMIALLAYPTLVEPHLALGAQARLWTVGYGALVLMSAACAALVWRSRGSDAGVPAAAPVAQPGDAPTPRRRAWWVLLAFVPSSLMVSVTHYLSTDIAAMPLLWVIPLALYLLTFILVFARRPPIPAWVPARAMPLLVLPLVVALASHGTDPIAVVIPLHLAAFFMAAMVCHGRLAADRPAPAYLTEFYLWISVGGALGGAFNALVAPLAFSSIAEYPIVLALACLMLPRSNAKPSPEATPAAAVPRAARRARLFDVLLPVVVTALSLVLVLVLQARRVEPGPAAAALMFGLPVIAAFSFARRPLRFALAVGGILWAGTFYQGAFGQLLHAERSFFGVHRVTLDATGRYRQLVHGGTLHGMQSLDPARRGEALTYYYRTGPLGQVFESFDRARGRRIALVGLGAGSVLSYARPGDDWTVYEIDPVVERIARDPRFFTFVRDSPAPVDVVLGDGRLSLGSAADGSYDLLIVDAFSSDSVPIHLLTREALQLYLSKLRRDGVLVFHISNRYFDLEPVLGNLGLEAQVSCLVRTDTTVADAEVALGKTGSAFALMTRSLELVSRLAKDRWLPARPRSDLRIWTDEYASALSVMRWRSGFSESAVATFGAVSRVKEPFDGAAGEPR
jgi:spermidine synthase